jgi:hypothetical protein
MRQSLFRLFDILSDLYRQSLSPITSLNRSLAAAHQSHVAARRALAIAIAEEGREADRRVLTIKTQDLEQRAVEALRAGRDDLATQAAEAIAAISSDIRATERCGSCPRSPRGRCSTPTFIGSRSRPQNGPHRQRPNRHHPRSGNGS